MSLREHEFEMILEWAGLSKRQFYVHGDDYETTPTPGLVSLHQIYDMLRYAYSMGYTDADPPTTP